MRLSVEATEAGIKAVRFTVRGRKAARLHRKDGAPLVQHWHALARQELRAYFALRLRLFSVPCDLRGLSPFTRAALKITAKIPYGKVRSYRWVAERLGKPRATRAVGNALGKNPIPIIIPCHRVIRSDGTLGGYASGLARKRRLLELERARPVE